MNASQVRYLRQAYRASLRSLPMWFAIGAATALIALLAPSTSAAMLIAIGLVLAILVKPWLALPLLAVAIPFAAVRPLTASGFQLDGADLLLLLALCAWLAQGIAGRRQIFLTAAPPSIPLMLLVGALALSLPGAQSYREGLPELLKWVQVLALFWCTIAILPPRRAPWLLAGVLLAGLGQGLLGIYQFLTQSGPEGFIILGRFMRAHGTFRQPNPYAGYLGLVVPLAIALSWWALRQTRSGQSAGGPNSGRTRRLSMLALSGGLLLVAVVGSTGLLLSWSRGGWLAFAAAVAATILVLSHRAAPKVVLWAGLLLLVGLGLGLFDLLPATLVDRLSGLQAYAGLDIRHVEIDDANFSVIERLAHWQAAISMWAEKPWFGVGIGNYAVAYPAYAVPRWEDPLGHAHNVYLNFGAETGLVGLIAYLVFWCAAGWQALRAAASSDRMLAAVGAGAFGALVHASLHNLFDNLWVQHVYLQLALLLGLMVALQANTGYGLPRHQDLSRR